MRTLVVYYSLTGNTRTIATALAKDLAADLEELRCTRYAPGFWGSIRAASDNWRGRLPSIEPVRCSPAQYQQVVVAGPIWAFHPAAPLRAYLKQVRDHLPRVAFLLTHGGSAGPKSLREMEGIVGHSPVASLTVKEADIRGQRFAAPLAAFEAQLQGRAAA
jgi:hypothetical protein